MRLFGWKHFSAPGGIQYLLRGTINKKPPARVSPRGLFSRTLRVNGPMKQFGRRLELFLVAEFAADDIAEQFPLLALEPHHLKLLDWGKIGGTGVDLDAREQGVGCKVLQAGGLFHDVFAGEIVAAHLNDL